MFVITQSIYDVAVLHNIMNTFGFGSVITQNKIQKTACFIVQDQVGNSLLVSLFNGNMVLPTRQARFLLFLEAYNQLILKLFLSEKQVPRKRKAIRPLTIVDKLPHTVLPTLEDAWITSLTDSEGCFHVRFSPSGYVIESHLNQKSELNMPILKYIKDLFGSGTIKPHHELNNWVWLVSGLKPCFSIQAYFKKYPLLSKKRLSFEKWRIIAIAIKAKKHLVPLEKVKLVALSKKVNPKIGLELLKVSKPLFVPNKPRRLVRNV
uniref:Putative site-specific DNA endonuclease n=1 Tax=Tupiella akineta TaxID=160070 RepID=Q6UVV2_TUPAK|nr:putative site-specific DNA endonuclease [Tupiella akineta]AAQ18720.1 putative site-specific DNA endonuclease [Tupiella akineta]